MVKKRREVKFYLKLIFEVADITKIIGENTVSVFYFKIEYLIQSVICVCVKVNSCLFVIVCEIY